MKIYTSDSNNVLVDRITKEIAELATANPLENYCVIVPEKFSVTMEKLVLEKSKSRTFLNVQVVTLSRLLYKLLASTNNYLSSVMGIMATKKVILENYDNLVCYKKTAKTMGFAENIYDTISELKNSKVTPEDYYKKNKTGTSLDIKLHDIFLLYKAYEDFIKRENLVDASDRFDLLTEEIYKSEYIKSSHVYIFGYDSTTRSGLCVFEAIARRAKSVTCACLDNSGKGNSYICPPEMLANYKEIAGNMGVSPTIVKIMTSKVSLSQHIANNMYAYPYSKMDADGKITLYEAKTVMEELSVVCEDIRRRVIEGGLRYRDFGVVCPDVDGYQDLVKMVFSEYELPYFIDVAEKLVEHPLTGFVESALNAIRKNYSADDVLLFSSNFFAGLSTYEYSKFENYCVKFAINYDDFKKPFVYKTIDPTDLEIAEKVRERIFSNLEKVRMGILKATTAKAINEQIRGLFELFDVDQKLEQFEDCLQNVNKLALRDATKQAKEKILGLLSGAEVIFGLTPISFDEYLAVLQSGFISETISLIPVTVDNVFVGDISTSKFFGIKDLYIIGATDGAVPKVKDDCGIIVDKELELISSTIGKKIEPTIKTINMREKQKLVNLLQEFSERLTVTYSLTSRSGEEQRASSLVRELGKIFYNKDKSKPLEVLTQAWLKRFKNLLPQNKRNDAYAYEFATKEVATQRLVSVMRNKRSGKPIEDSMQYDSLYSFLTEKGNEDIKAVFNEIVENKPAPVLKNASKLYFKDNKTSVSQLECYFACPFKFFANFGLRLKPRDEAFLKSVDYGNVLHKIAEIYIRNIKKFDIDNGRPFEEKMKEIEKLINFVFSEEKLKTANNKHMLLQLKKEAFRLIDALTYQYRESNFKPTAEELVFGKNGKVNGVKLTKNISIEGKIDRVDTFKNFYRVIDYKTGHIDLTPKTTYYGGKVQLFMYLLAMREVKGMKPAGAFYLPIRNVFIDENEGTNYSTYKMQGYYNNSPEAIGNMDRRLSPENNKSDIVNVSVSGSKENKASGQLVATGNNAFTEDELMALSAYTKLLCSTAVDEILSGYTKPSPMEQDGRTPCEYCEFKYACGRDFNTTKDIRKQMANIKHENILIKEKGNDTK